MERCHSRLQAEQIRRDECAWDKKFHCEVESSVGPTALVLAILKTFLFSSKMLL